MIVLSSSSYSFGCFHGYEVFLSVSSLLLAREVPPLWSDGLNILKFKFKEKSYEEKDNLDDHMENLNSTASPEVEEGDSMEREVIDLD